MVEVKRGRGRPRKETNSVFNFERTKRPVGRPPKAKIGRPKGSKNKPKVRLPKTLTVERRLDVLEFGLGIIVEALTIIFSSKSEKKKNYGSTH